MIKISPLSWVRVVEGSHKTEWMGNKIEPETNFQKCEVMHENKKTFM